MSVRAEQIGEVIKRELNNFIIKELEPPKDSMITITGVELTNDLEKAFIRISVLPVSKAGSAMEYFKKQLGGAAKYLQHNMVMRRVPKMEILIDDYALKHRRIEKALED